MKALPILLASTCCAVLLAAPAVAQDDREALERIAVDVTSANGPVVTLNRGASSGIAKGDTVVFLGPALRDVVGVVVSVRQHECTVELENYSDGVALGIGLPAEVLVPRERAVPDGKSGDVPEHPPWQEPVGEWAPGTPLLAPVSSPSPEDRDSDWRGRVFTRAQYTDDKEGDRSYTRWWTGVDVSWTNPFDQGGELRFDGDVSYRDFMTGSRTEDETLTRVQRLSYAVGGRDTDAYRLEVGRFLTHVFPEFGVIDGVEAIRRFDNGSQLGGSVGFLTEFSDEFSTTDDLATSLFYRWVESPEERVALALGYQKTWHEGNADRDLLAGSANWVITDQTTLLTRALVDYYDSTANLESESFELTEFHASLNHRFGVSGGAGVYGSYFDWPELLRDDFPTPPPTTISDQKVKRAGANGWVRVADGVTVYGRFDLWTDDENSGDFADLRVDLRDVLYEGSNVSIGAFSTRGSFTDGFGGGVLWTHWFGPNSLRLGYDVTQYTQDGFVGTQSELVQHVAGFGFDSRLTDDVDLTADAEQRFGDELDALNLVLRVTWRF